MVLEGVHIVPGMISVDRADALVVQCVVAISDEDLHRSHFWVRDAATDGLRPLEKYLDGMTEIRMIQDVLLERARRFDVPVIENTSFDEAIGQMLDLVLTGRGAARAGPDDRLKPRRQLEWLHGHRERRHRGAARGRGSRARHGHRRDRPLLRGRDRGLERARSSTR